MKIANPPYGIDLHIEKQLKRVKIEAHRLAQIGLWWRGLEHGGAGLQQAKTSGSDTRKHRLSALDKSIRVDRGERGNRRNAFGHDVPVRAAEKWDKCEIVRRGKPRDAVRVPVAKLADTRIARERQELSRKDRARVEERRFIFVPQSLARECGEVVVDLIAQDVPDEGAPPC